MLDLNVAADGTVEMSESEAASFLRAVEARVNARGCGPLGSSLNSRASMPNFVAIVPAAVGRASGSRIRNRHVHDSRRS